MAGEVLLSIETGDPLSANASVLSDGTYREEEGTPEPDDPEEYLYWGRKHNGEGWYQEELAGREAARKARREEEERDRSEDRKVEAIRKLQDTDPLEYEHQMMAHNLRLQGCTEEEIAKSIAKSNQPLPKDMVKRNWEAFSTLLGGKVLEPVTADNGKPTKEVPHKDVKRTTRPASALTKTLVGEGRASNATNVKPSQPKHHKAKLRRVSTANRASRRLAGNPVECGIFAEASAARPVPKSLQRSPSTRKPNSANSRNHAPSKETISVGAAKGISTPGREKTRRSRRKQSGG
ncbi:hypothetical protein ACEPPN_006506 [Leptodophora sp. 'Broadleaf-Isolate-01']